MQRTEYLELYKFPYKGTFFQSDGSKSIFDLPRGMVGFIEQCYVHANPTASTVQIGVYDDAPGFQDASQIAHLGQVGNGAAVAGRVTGWARGIYLPPGSSVGLLVTTGGAATDLIAYRIVVSFCLPIQREFQIGFDTEEFPGEDADLQEAPESSPEVINA